MDLKARNELYNKNRGILKQAYPRIKYHPLFGYDTLALADIYYSEHATNDLSLRGMIIADKGEAMANLIESLL